MCVCVCVCRYEPDSTTPDHQLCEICMDHNVEVMLDCGHYLCAMCMSGCANPWLKCPFCRAKIQCIAVMDGVPHENIPQLCLGKPTEEEPPVWFPDPDYRDLLQAEFIDIEDDMYMRDWRASPYGFRPLDPLAFDSSSSSSPTHENQEDNVIVVE